MLINRETRSFCFAALVNKYANIYYCIMHISYAINGKRYVKIVKEVTESANLTTNTFLYSLSSSTNVQRQREFLAIN